MKQLLIYTLFCLLLALFAGSFTSCSADLPSVINTTDMMLDRYDVIYTSTKRDTAYVQVGSSRTMYIRDDNRLYIKVIIPRVKRLAYNN